MLYNKHLLKFTAKVMLLSMTYQMVYPSLTFALTSGPTQPEVKSFEPVGTTDMVDLFTGDFVYNIPLLDVEGYPVNISYHSGGDMEQESSWVGYGWNINPGVINRSVRGLPDDFKGEVVGKTINIKPEKNTRIGMVNGAEPLGVGRPPVNLDISMGSSLNFSNYRGVSSDVNISLQASVNVVPRASAGINIGVGSQSGADIDYNLGLTFNTSSIIGGDMAGGVGFTYGHGYNTRSGVKDKVFGISTSASIGGKNVNGPSFSKVVPIGVKNMVPVITNRANMVSYRGQIKVGGEIAWTLMHGAIYGQMSKLEYDKDGSRPGFGYFYAQDASVDAIQDFTRDKDGLFNETMHFLPLGNMTYDVYAVSGQGTGGSFRPFRNDFGTVYDPAIAQESEGTSINIEAGIGWLFEVGGDGHFSHTDITSGPWTDYQRPFTRNKKKSLYENVYFKQAGELTMTDTNFYASIGKFTPIKGTQTKNIPLKRAGTENKRDPRANLITYFTGAEASDYGVASSRKIASYPVNGFPNGANTAVDSIDRIDGNRKSHFMSEIVQTQTDGRRYIYGIAAMNNVQKEKSFAVSSQGNQDGLVTYSGTEDSEGNKSGIDNFYTETTTPAYAHSYLLTSVLSTDYVDVTGNGVTDDDFGSYTKFNYSRKDANYQWRAPYSNNLAQYNEGFRSDKQDNKASYLSGSREQWMLHSIETKNNVAEFYTSLRADGKGAGSGNSYKLDSIKLYNKHERFANPSGAVPIKMIIFSYDYSLCKKAANNSNFINGATDNTSGKLTLKKIYIKYGNSEKSMISPYQFEYDEQYNYDYSYANKDRWGIYKPNRTDRTNTDYPFVDQEDPNNNKYASAWSLTRIKLPSGGAIQISYESDDYAYVQDKEVMDMFMLKGIGNTKNFVPGSQLYSGKQSPNTYFYFKRRVSKENPNRNLKDNYLKGQNILYYNFETQLTDKKESYEPIKGYAEVEEVGKCENDTTYAYIKTKPVEVKGGGSLANHVSYTGINFGRYYLPHVIFPGSDPDNPDMLNILAGMAYGLKELLFILQNPVTRMIGEGKAKYVKLETSFMRLNTPGLKKQGGGQRVATLQFYDNWSQLAGGNTQDATYGKKYNYTVDDGNGFKISSGVASYEPLVGGDENPLRTPVDYTAQSGSKFPPNDPVGLYQEMPVGESLYPGPIVGYSRVSVESINRAAGRSAQGLDISEFYTAKDFPIIVESTPKEVIERKKEYDFMKQEVTYKATQGYVLRFNDMHGKPKRTEHRVMKPGTNQSELISYQHYKYQSNGKQLDNTVPTLEYDGASGKMKRMMRQLGVEVDLTIDTREKKESTKDKTIQANVNVTNVGPVPVPIIYPFWWEGNYDNSFNAVVATKVIQQYGILMEVESLQEGAVTTMRNEAFDPVTGQALITSINNEYRDKEYSVNYPAYWGYKSMGPAYANINYEDEYSSLPIENYAIKMTNVENTHYKIGDEIIITYNINGVPQQNNVWVMDAGEAAAAVTESYIQCAGQCLVQPTDVYDTVVVPNPESTLFNYICSDEHPYVHHFPKGCRFDIVLKPRFKYSWPQNGTITNVKMKIVRSGAKNQLTESMQNYTGMSTPFENDNSLKNDLTDLINISAKVYSDNNTAILPQFDPSINPGTWDSLNSYVNGTKQVKRLYQEYAYLKNRNYGGNTNRKAGLFDAHTLWSFDNVNPDSCIGRTWYCVSNTTDSGKGYFSLENLRNRVYLYHDFIAPDYTSDYGLLNPNTGGDPNWIIARTITKWSPWGFELENKDATGNYTAAQYGYNQQLPVALAQNARQHQIFSEGFEDYKMLLVKNNKVGITISPFQYLLQMQSLSAVYNVFSMNTAYGFNLSTAAAHTGNYSIQTSTFSGLSIAATNANIANGGARYLPFNFTQGQQYIISFWYKPQSSTANGTSYAVPAGYTAKSNIIEGWQQFEAKVTIGAGATTYFLSLPTNAYIDDIRIMPAQANMKSFVYNPVNQRLMATLDENNFASFYEYDQEGNLIRTKKETEKGIMTVSESRSANPKSN